MKYLIWFYALNPTGIKEPIVWIFIGFIIAESFHFLCSKIKSRGRIKFLKTIDGKYIAAVKDNPKITNAIISVYRRKDSKDVIEFVGISCKASNYRGTIVINSSTPKTGSGHYMYSRQNLNRGEFIGFGTIGIIIKSENLIEVNRIYQRNNKDVNNPEVWRKVEGEDEGKSVSFLKKKYMESNAQN